MDQTTRLETDIEGFRIYLYRYMVEQMLERNCLTLYTMYRTNVSCFHEGQRMMSEEEFHLFYGNPHPRIHGLVVPGIARAASAHI